MTRIIKQIIVDPRFKINYLSYYLYGIKRLYGERIIKYKCIEDIDVYSDVDCRIGSAILVETDDLSKKIYIDYGDWSSVNKSYYQWADVYAKINVLPEYADDLDKLLVIGPSFGVQLWNPFKSLYKGIKHYWLIKKCCGERFGRSLFQYVMDYGYMFIRRKKYNYYHRFTHEEQNGYFFSYNTLWYDEVSHANTNRLRGNFMRAAKSLMNRFEGGFFYIDSSSVLNEFPKYETYLNSYSEFISKRRIPMSVYEKKTRESWFVFNTPSVAGCHGWKLAEYLCKGKAIISTNLINLMPGDFENGIHYIEANTSQEMSDAIIRLRDDEELVHKLKENAFNYFESFLAPEVVIRRIFHRAGLIE